MYTGKWVRDDGAYGPYTSTELAENYTSEMAGTWIREHSSTWANINRAEWFEILIGNPDISLQTATSFKRVYDYNTVSELPDNAVMISPYVNTSGRHVYAWRDGSEVKVWADVRFIQLDYDCSYLFADCTLLTDVDLSGFDFYYVDDARGMFKNCSSLVNVNLEVVEHYGPSSAGCNDWSMAFAGCTSLQSVKLPVIGCIEEWAENQSVDLSNMFMGCTSLHEVDLTQVESTKLGTLVGMFYNCPNLKTIYVRSDWQLNGDGSRTNMFTGCTSLVGGAGTVFDAEHTGGSYACIDSLPNIPGYLTVR
jgi:hypothetical protein